MTNAASDRAKFSAEDNAFIDRWNPGRVCVPGINELQWAAANASAAARDAEELSDAAVPSASSTAEDHSGVWYICCTIGAYGSGEWGRGRTIEAAKANAKKAGGKFRNYYVCKVTQRTGAQTPPSINEMGGLSWWADEGANGLHNPTVEKVMNGKKVPAEKFDSK